MAGFYFLSSNTLLPVNPVMALKVDYSTSLASLVPSDVAYRVHLSEPVELVVTLVL